MDEKTSTKNFFESHHITLSDYWLESCIEWFKEENPNLSYTLETLHSTVYAQWLLLDLRDVEISILPQNINQHKKFVLNNSFCLQMLHIQDISQPKYQQIQKIRNSGLLIDASINQEYTPTVTSKRMLQMLLTDGVQEIEGIEYKPIKVLNINLKPGTKIRIKGPVTVRRGQILLEEKHVFILGGEVEELLVTNAHENVLARALKLPENPNPNLVEEMVESINEVVSVQATRNTIDQYLNNHNLNMAPSTSTLNNKTTNSNNNLSSKPNQHIEEFDDEFITNQIDMLLEVERDNAREVATIRPKSNPDDDYIFLQAEKNMEQETLKPATSHDDFTNTSKAKYDEDDDILQDMDIDAHLDMIDKQQEITSSVNVVTPIKSLLNNKDSNTWGQFTINAKFKKVIQKLTVTDSSWLLKLLVGDDTGDLEVRVDSKVVSDLIGYTPSDVMDLRKDVMNNDKSATTALMKVITGLKQKLIAIDGKLVISFKSKEDTPSIIEIL